MTAGAAAPMRIAELARRTGVSRETVHFYLREGLIPRPRKTGRNMAWYDESHVERINVIKKLQQEKYLPLSVIKRVLRGGRPERLEDVELLADLFRLTGERPPSQIPAARLAARAKVPLPIVRAARASGMLAEDQDDQGRPVHGQDDVELLQLLNGLAEDAGFGQDFAMELARTATLHVRELVKDEARLVFGRFLRGDQPAEAIRSLERSRGAMNRLVVALRGRLMQRQIADYFEQLEGAIEGSEHLAVAPLGQAALRRTRFAALERDHAARAHARTADAAAVARLCALLAGVGQFARAAAEAERGLARTPDDPGLLRLAGASRFELGNDDDAIAHLTRAAERDPADPIVQAYLGSAWLRRARTRVSTLGAAALAEAGAGIAALTRSRDLRPASRADALRLGLVRGRVYGALPRFMGLFDDGLAELRRVLAYDHAGTAPETAALGESGELLWLTANAELLLAQLHEASGARAEATACAGRAERLDPDGPVAARARKLVARLQDAAPRPRRASALRAQRAE